MPSRAEGLPLTLVEAQAHGLPIVASDIKYGPRDVVTDGKDGFLVESRNVDQLADRIIDLLSDPKKLAAFSENAIRIVGTTPQMQSGKTGCRSLRMLKRTVKFPKESRSTHDLLFKPIY
nr:glycosyltransferase [Lentilactobacillus parafarraginis]